VEAVMDHAKFFRIQQALNRVLDEHLGPNPKRPPILDASNIMTSLIYPVEAPLPGFMVPAMRRKQEREKLQRLNRAAREFARAWNDMHSDVRDEVQRLGEAAYDGDGLGFKTEVERMCFWRTLAYLDRMVGAAVPQARALINAAPEAGKSDTRIVDIIGALRATWKYRKGKPAPKNIAEGSSFYKFLCAAFEAMELKNNVRSSMNAWRKFTNKNPSGTRHDEAGYVVVGYIVPDKKTD
jgi:hypothetical protein